jgi:hypothetical protein
MAGVHEFGLLEMLGQRPDQIAFDLGAILGERERVSVLNGR